MGATCSRSASTDGSSKDTDIIDSNLNTTERKERGEIEESMSVMNEDERPLIEGVSKDGTIDGVLSGAEDSDNADKPMMPNLVSDTTTSDPIHRISSMKSEPDPSTNKIETVSLDDAAKAKSDDADIIAMMKIRSAASLTADADDTVEINDDVISPEVVEQYSSDIATSSVDYSTDGSVSVDMTDDDGDIDADNPPIHDATVEIYLMTAYLGSSDPDAAGATSPPGLGRMGSRSRAASARMKRSASVSGKDVGGTKSQRKGVYVKMSYKVNTSHGGKKQHKEISSKKYQSRGYDGDIVDFQESIQMGIAMKDDRIEEKDLISDKSYLNDEIEVRLKQQKKSAMSKAKLLGRAAFKLNDLKRDGEWQELKLKLRPNSSSSSSKATTTEAGSGVSTMDIDTDEESVGTLRIKARLHWSSDKLSEFHEEMVRMQKRSSTRSLLLSSESGSLSSRTASESSGGHRRTASLLSGMKASDVHKFFLSHSGDMNVRIIGALFGNETVEEWTIFETDEEWRKEIKSQGSASEMMKSQIEDVEILVEFKSPTDSKEFQTDKHSSKLRDVLYFGESTSFPVKPFDNGGEGSRKIMVDHPQIVLSKDTNIHNAPGSIFFKMGKQTKYGTIQIGCALIKVSDMLDRLRYAKDMTEDSWLLIHQPLYEWMTEETFSMKLPNLFDTSSGTGAESERPTPIGELLIDIQCKWHE